MRDTGLSLTAAQLDGRGHLVTVIGDVDIATAPQIAEYLVRFTDGPVTVELSGVSFLDSSGINALLAAHRHLERRDSRLTIRGATPIVRRVLQISGLDQLLNLESQPYRPVWVPETRSGARFTAAPFADGGATPGRPRRG